MALLQRYREAYPRLLADVDEQVSRRLEATLSTTRDGRLWPAPEVAALIDRLSGRITFQEYLDRGRQERQTVGCR